MNLNFLVMYLSMLYKIEPVLGLPPFGQLQISLNNAGQHMFGCTPEVDSESEEESSVASAPSMASAPSLASAPSAKPTEVSCSDQLREDFMQYIKDPKELAVSRTETARNNAINGLRNILCSVNDFNASCPPSDYSELTNKLKEAKVTININGFVSGLKKIREKSILNANKMARTSLKADVYPIVSRADCLCLASLNEYVQGSSAETLLENAFHLAKNRAVRELSDALAEYEKWVNCTLRNTDDTVRVEVMKDLITKKDELEKCYKEQVETLSKGSLETLSTLRETLSKELEDISKSVSQTMTKTLPALMKKIDPNYKPEECGGDKEGEKDKEGGEGDEEEGSGNGENES